MTVGVRRCSTHRTRPAALFGILWTRRTTCGRIRRRHSLRKPSSLRPSGPKLTSNTPFLLRCLSTALVDICTDCMHCAENTTNCAAQVLFRILKRTNENMWAWLIIIAHAHSIITFERRFPRAYRSRLSKKKLAMTAEAHSLVEWVSMIKLNTTYRNIAPYTERSGKQF